MKRLNIFLLTLIIIVTGCSSDKKLKLIEKNFEDEVPLQAILSFTFSKEIVPDSLVGIWTDKEYIRFEPKVDGKFHWQTSSTLVFAPREGFSPATNYSARFSNLIFAHVKKLKYKGEKQFEFHTPYLEVLASRAFWEVSEENKEQGLRVELEFSYPVSAVEAASLLNLKIDGKESNFRVITNDYSDKLSIWVPDIKKEDKDYSIEVKMDKGLTPEGGSVETTEVYVEQFDIPSPFKLEITDFQANHDGIEGSIMLYTTQQVLDENVKKFIKITPAVRYTVEVEPGYLLIKSEDFSIDQQYEISVAKGLSGRIGGVLKFDFSQPISFGEVEPTIRFQDENEYYLSGRGSRNIQVAIMNVPKVQVTISKIYENNLLKYLGNNYYDDYYYYEYDDYYYNNNEIGNLGDVIYEKEVETSTLARKGSNRILALDFEDKLAENKGIYVIEVRSTEDYWLRASKMVAISDIGLIVKQGKNQITVFANSIKTAQPLANVSLRFIGNNNQVVYSTKTDATGVAKYEYTELKATGFATSMVTAQLNEDYNVILLDRTRINTSRFDVGGKYPNPSGMEAFIYGDRDLYRPGETINISTIVRDETWKIPDNLTMILKIIAPNGKTYKTLRKVLNKYGSFDSQIVIPASAQTGSYIVNVFTGNEVLIGSKVIKIEEFMPDRIKVNLSLNKTEFKPGENIEVGIEAQNFFGPPAAGRNYEVELSTQRINFYPKKNSNYSYYIEGIQTSFSNIFRQNTTDDAGTAREVFDIPIEYKNMGTLRCDVFATVFDETGRPVNRLKQMFIYTQDIFFGVKTDDYYVRTNQAVKFDLIAVDKNGEALTDIEAQIKLIRYEYKTVLSKSGGYFRYRSEKVEKVLQDKKIKINSTSTTFGFLPDRSGEYELRIAAPGVSSYVKRRLYAYGWGSTTYSSFKVNKEGQIDIEPDKPNYQVGEKAKILLKAPFTGRILVTLETDKVIDHFYIETDKRAASFTLDIKEEYLPNVYISATLFRPHEESDIPLTVAHGYASLKVDNPSYKMPVTIEAAEKSRSNTKQTIKVKAKPNSAITLAVVDEGILQVAGYATPDPYNFYYQKQALGVNTSNVYPYLFPEIGMVRSNTGGDGSELEKRLNPIQNNRVKLVTFWSGILETNSKGEAVLDINIPQFSGDLRIMAVGYNGPIFGSAQKNIKVADPLVISVALPRFMSPGDKVLVPVVLTNTTNKETRCKTSLRVEGPLKISSESSGTITIGPSKEVQVLFEVEASQSIGASKVIVEAQALGETFVNTTDISVRPASPLQKRSGSGVIIAGNSIKLPVDNKGFIASSTDGKLIISKNPLVQYSNSLDYLVRYPYGCIEQTVSSAFPQIYFGDLVNTLFKNQNAQSDAIRNVQYALDRIKLMQLYNGGLTYWPEGGSETWWGSVYAAHFALEAKKAGFEVDESFLKLLLKYLKKKLEKKELITYYYNYDKRKQIAPKEAIYSLYVLTLAGEKPISLLNYYRSRTDQISLDCQYMLAAAYALTGNMDRAREVLPPAFEGEKSNTSSGGSFYSYIRDEALALNVLLEIDPQNSQVGIMAKHISDALKNSRYLNTQERTFSFLAMGKIARMASASNIKGSVKIGGKTVQNFDNTDLHIPLKTIGNKSIELLTEGSGQLYYYWETEGITSDGSYLEEDNYLKVRRRYFNRSGQLVTNNTFSQNDLVLVEVSLAGLTSQYIENIAISDILPACFEIENPRLTVLPPGMNFPNKRRTPEYMDIRDDRIIFFTGANNYTRYFYYLVRVVSKGTFNTGPVGADAMYNGEYHSYHGGGVIKVPN